MKKRWMKWTVLICFFEQIKAYNVREEADGIIGPGLGTNVSITILFYMCI